jgi:hypothetical protein
MPPRIDFRLRVTATISTGAVEADAYLAIVENGLQTAVTRGENRGKRLQHDFVLRTMLGPFAINKTGPHEFATGLGLAADIKPEHSSVVAFVEDRRTGEVLQALAAPLCAS